MKIYIIAEKDNVCFAKNLISDVNNVRIISDFSQETIEKSIYKNIVNKIRNADAILVVIDNKFNKNIYLQNELQIAKMVAEKNENKLLIPIILNNADIPECIEGVLRIECNPKVEKDISKAKLMLKTSLSESKKVNNIKKKMRLEIIH